MKMLVIFEKSERLRHIGHLDLMRAMQRALRRSGVKSVHDIGEDDWDEEDVDDEDGPEIIYVRD